MFIAGTGCMVMSIVSAFKARPKYDEIMAERDRELAKRKKAIDIADSMEDGDEKYPEENRLIDRVRIGMVTGMKTAVAFWKVVAFGGAALGFFFGYGRIYKGWFLGAASAATLANKKLRAFEAATLAEVGEDKMKDIKNKVFADAVEERYETDEEGKRHVKENSPTRGMIKWFDELCPLWREGDPDANYTCLQNIEKTCDIRLQAQGYLFANEIWDELHLPRTTYGNTWGILRDQPDGSRKHVDFGLRDGRDPAVRNFVNGIEDHFLIKPNFEDQPIIMEVGYEEE
jgi:hypothetical protein